MRVTGRRVLFGTPEETDEEIRAMIADLEKQDKAEEEERRRNRKLEIENERIENMKTRRRRVRQSPSRRTYTPA